MVKMRTDATIDNNVLHQNLSKILMNSSWGRLAMDVANRRNTVYSRSGGLKDSLALIIYEIIYAFGRKLGF